MRNRQQQPIPQTVAVPLELDFSKLKNGMRTLDDAILSLGSYRTVNRNYSDKTFILQAIENHDYNILREVSSYFYEANGIYQRMCKYLALLYRYDWCITAFNSSDTYTSDKFLKDYSKILNYFDNSEVRRLLGNVALEVVKNGTYYGYITEFDDKFTIQQLPSQYCRVRYFSGVNPVVELNLKFFDSYFTNADYRLKVLKLFPKDVQVAYIKYKKGTLPKDYPSDTVGWYALDPELSVKFCLNNSDFPPLSGAIPSIIDLDQAQDLDRKKTMQQLLKIIIQKLPLDKNGDMIFDMDEMKDMHNNAVNMLKRAIGVDVLTTIADIDVADMQDSNSTTKTDDLAKVERTVYNNLGVSQNLFNTDGNIAMEKSIANDEATMRDLLLQFQSMLNKIAKRFDKSKYNFKVNILETTIYNYKEMSKMYKEQTQIGFSKLLPQIALGHLQSDIIASIQFENQALHLQDIMIPPLMSSTMSSKNLGNTSQSSTAQNQDNTGGRPEKSDEEKSDKTLANRESM